MNEIIINMFTPTITLANLVDSLTPFTSNIVSNNIIIIAGKFIAIGILSNKNGICV